MLNIKFRPFGPDKLELMNGLNRTPNERQINILIESMKTLDLQKFKPVMVYKNKIIDGQHRYLARERMQLGTWVVDLEELSDDQVFKAIHLLNSNSKNWTSNDYINLYANLSEDRTEFRDYDLLRNIVKEHGISPSIAVYFLSGFKTYKSAINDEFKDGHFRVLKQRDFEALGFDGKPLPVEIAEELFEEAREKIVNTAFDFIGKYVEVRNDIVDFYPKNQKTRFVKSPNFIFAFCNLAGLEDYNHDSFLVALKNDVTKETPVLTHCDSVSKYFEQLAKIYNTRAKVKIDEVYKPKQSDAELEAHDEE